ncbi:hypothetical protein PTKIN_Ptkin16aG0038800 [Pterospermum kingtungense]
MAFIGEAALSAFFQSLFGKFTSLEFEFVTEKRVRKEIMNWETTLKNIHAVLADAEGKQMHSQAVKIWLADLQDLAYDVDDILDEFATEALGRKLMKQHQATSSKPSKLMPISCTGLRQSSVMFNYNLMSKIKEITGRLEGLAARKSNLQLREITCDVGRPMTIQRRPPSTCLVNEATIRGRGNDKRAILDLLVRNDGIDAAVYSVIPIVGMGGIGKTTLAQLVYNDESIKDHFDLRAWVCVSDEFDIIRTTKTILLSVTSDPCDTNDFNLLQVKLKEKLLRKKFLLVLDDVWNENYNDWLKLRSPFDAGEPGSKIIVTTRSSSVSSTITTVAGYSLQCLSEEDSLSMLAYDALEKEDFTEHSDLKEIGLEILKKCDGLPLATKTIAGLLRTRVNRDAWREILESDIWNLPPGKSRNGSGSGSGRIGYPKIPDPLPSLGKSDIVPALCLSYYYLPSHLKQCFAYCSLLPKDYEFNEKEIVLLWMAEGFLNGANNKTKFEDLGSKYFRELVSRSFFQASSKDKSQFVMHSLINDLAHFVGGEKFFKIERHEEMKWSSHTLRHFSYIVDVYDEIKKFENFSEAKSLRTFLAFDMLQYWWLYGWYYLSNNVLNDLLPRLKCLRALSLKRYNIYEIPDFIGNLRHLRFLDFSYTRIKGLPDSICTLYNLHSSIEGLLELSNFIVGQGDALNIREMQNLSNLKGQLSISELQNVNEAQDAREARLSSKPELDDLEMKWSGDFDEDLRKKEVETEVLNLLRPHGELKALAIKNYAGLAFPNWIEDPSFKYLQSLKFQDCPNCTFLPAVGKLPLLKDLSIKGMSSLVSVGNELYGENWPEVFPSLETLHFEDLPKWIKWNATEVNEQGRKFQFLRELLIVNCPKLIGTLPEYLTSLKKLVIRKCQDLVVSISNLPILCELEIDGCKEVLLGSFTDLWSVKKINLSNISKFALVTEEEVVLESIKVEDLNLNGWEELDSFCRTRWGCLVPLRSLRNLKLEHCPEVISIGATSEEEIAELQQLDIPCNIEHLRLIVCECLEKLCTTMHSLTCLRELEIVKCPKLVSLVADSLPSTLKRLVISECENLVCLFEDVENSNFSSTSLLESLKIRKCEALKSLSLSSKLPLGLKTLNIGECPQLEIVAQEVGNDTCLVSIEIWSCVKIQCLPQGLDKLNRLQSIRVYKCPDLVCFPENGFPTTNLKSVWIENCEKLEALPNLYSLQLQELYIQNCPRVRSILEGGLPTNIQRLYIYEPNISKAVMEWGLHRLTSLKYLCIDGSKCIEAVSFPQGITEEALPPSLNLIYIKNFKNIRKLSSRGFRSLSSLQSLWIRNCPKLKSLPKKEILPSLLQLWIWECPELKKRCKRDKGKYWPNISHIPCVEIDDKFIYE